MWPWLSVYENGTPLSVLLAGFDCFGIYTHSPSTLVTRKLCYGEDAGESFINGSETGVYVIFASWMNVCALFWSSWLGWCQPGFCFHQGRADWATWYPHCALCVSAEGMELHLQGSSGGNLWLLDSKPPPPKHSHIDECQTPNPPPHSSPHVPPPSYKSPGSLPARPASSARDPRAGFRLWGRVWFQNMMPWPRGPFQLCSQR